MGNIIVGMVTYGQVKYTRMAIKYLFENAGIDFDFIGVIGKPGDIETKKLFEDKDLFYIEHEVNWGFPKSLNDIYEHSFIKNNYDYCIIIGNDVLVYPDAIKDLVDFATSNNSDYVSGQEINARRIREAIPELQKYFGYGGKLLKDDFPEFMKYNFEKTKRKYDLSSYKIIGDTHNMSLFSRNWFNNVGYVDVNFYPAYFEDNDYARRGQLLGMKMFQIQRAKYFHFWSRTIKEDSKKKRENDFYFPLNKKYYIEKWGGEPGKEKFSIPFNGNTYVKCGILQSNSLNIKHRYNEERIIKCWKEMT